MSRDTFLHPVYAVRWRTGPTLHFSNSNKIYRCVSIMADIAYHWQTIITCPPIFALFHRQFLLQAILALITCKRINALGKKTGAQNTVQEIKQYQKKWLQRVRRMDVNRISKQTLQYKPKGRRNIRRSRNRWRDQFHLEDQGTVNTPNTSWTWWWW
jgi:hypothetical protein